MIGEYLKYNLYLSYLYNLKRCGLDYDRLEYSSKES
jgi:hypothetical protein